MGPNQRIAEFEGTDANDGGIRLGRSLRAELDAAEVLGADEPVLKRADQPDRRSVFGFELFSVQPIGQEDVVGSGVPDLHHGSVSVETTKDQMTDRRVWLQGGLDDSPVEGVEWNPLPVQAGRGPSGHAVEVGCQFPPRKLAETGERDAEGLSDRAGDLDRGIEGNLWRRPVKAGPESREPIDGALSGR
jgi:hypothetical protein